MTMFLLARGIANGAPPEPRSKLQNNPTLLFSWWCTCFSFVIILFRLGGRYVRTERLFREDKVMALSIIPLLIRMGLIHVVLLNGTNNVNIEGRTLSVGEISRRETGAKVVLAARIFYAMFVWIAKYTVSEFLKRLTERFWKKNYDYFLRAIRGFLVVTFFFVVIATLVECQPFDHYWQVVPDPGPRCRQGYAHLVVMGVTDIMTDVLLIVFPIPIIIRSAMSMKRKFDLIMLFSMSLILIGITAARVPMVIDHLGRQQYRTVFASGEILAATAVSNAVVIGSFLRDRGVKKVKKYKFGSVTESMERSASVVRPPLTAHHWGSDEDLIRDVGMRLDPSLHANRRSYPRPAPVGMPAVPEGKAGFSEESWQFPRHNPDEIRDSEESDLKIMQADPHPSPRDVSGIPTRRNMSFFDVGGLLEDGSMRSSTLVPSPTSTTSAQDWANVPRKGSRALLHDLGGLLSQSNNNTTNGQRRVTRNPESDSESYELPSRTPNTANTTNAVRNSSPLTRTDTLHSLQDVGGLLAENDPASRQPRPLVTSGPAVTSGAIGLPNSHPRSTFPASSHPQEAAEHESETNGLPSLSDAGGLLKENEERPP